MSLVTSLVTTVDRPVSVVRPLQRVTTSQLTAALTQLQQQDDTSRLSGHDVTSCPVAACDVIIGDASASRTLLPEELRINHVTDDVTATREENSGDVRRRLTEVATSSAKIAIVAPFQHHPPSSHEQQQQQQQQQQHHHSNERPCLQSCPFYHGPISAAEAKSRLRGTEPGTFLLRDSQSGSHPLALTLRTSGRTAVTSVRIARSATGQYRLDCDDKETAKMPLFDDVLALVKHFTVGERGGSRTAHGRSSPAGRCVLLTGSGVQSEKPLSLTRGLEVNASLTVSGS